ncbi:hypothetical protein [Leptolyngbya sp. PCC 6406]|uniref:hypothetical protein n=1 Tax=Leptolyngbya sp. PCC 6406 TaxID=1173264 RepID=UPI0002AC9916|nr:hypothetical protein [Leptolyngbya sp. PCC 6406]
MVDQVDRGIQIQESAVGSAIVSGDGNTIYVIHQTTPQRPEPAANPPSLKNGLLGKLITTKTPSPLPRLSLPQYPRDGQSRTMP